jgi:hypothetical protein
MHDGLLDAAATCDQQQTNTPSSHGGRRDQRIAGLERGSCWCIWGKTIINIEEDVGRDI